MSAEIAPEDVSSPSKERHSLTLDQRRALRRWASSQPVRPSHKACIDWFQSQYNQTISQSTVSHSLSPKYARLDGDTQLSGSRLRFGNWPDVEKLVLLWHQQMVNSGRHPSNEELAEKAKNIFTQLPRYKDENPPEFSPGWIHRFKKRYGLLIRRQRRHGSAQNAADDIPYLIDAVPRFMNITPEVSPAAIRDAVQRVVGRGNVPRHLGAPHATNGDTPMYTDEDPEVVLQNALRALQQEEADAEAQAAAEREARDRSERGMPPLGTIAGQAYAQQAAAAVNAISTPINTARASVGPPPSAGGGNGGTAANSVAAPRFIAPTPQPTGSAGSAAGEDLTLTPIPSGGPVSVTDRPVRCPFCLNQRMLRTIKEAVEHMSTHVIV
ncbi:hypothetical protein CHGG_04180 [Chaetomium globosum CBS 148.51]|uniref:HTH CENPB-type domain-containing protein n=1 Tax=Chaetomium globosum (strain ATCC 6205 / CBS 148.51 / DSM 1962 / NBRC 6347 / NRRL 1970) TaxID=306901 RepID=Q2H216_CHAGB|nr:uncharacterized protein CHGG_04180 [Chaetomium globosum CBS 148.51]EAQ87561.1 hypothetical protein CHGG_04180 [Chaetomium globosum CBS 148.51]